MTTEGRGSSGGAGPRGAHVSPIVATWLIAVTRPDGAVRFSSIRQAESMNFAWWHLRAAPTTPRSSQPSANAPRPRRAIAQDRRIHPIRAGAGGGVSRADGRQPRDAGMGRHACRRAWCRWQPHRGGRRSSRSVSPSPHDPAASSARYHSLKPISDPAAEDPCGSSAPHRAQARHRRRYPVSIPRAVAAVHSVPTTCE